MNRRTINRIISGVLAAACTVSVLPAVISAETTDQMSFYETENDEEILPESISFLMYDAMTSSNTAEMSVGDRFAFGAKVSPSNATYKMIKWSTNDPSVISIEDMTQGYCIVSGKKGGTAVLTATAHNGVSASCSVSVKSWPSSVSISQDSVTLKPDGVITLNAAISPADVTENYLSWYSSNIAVASVDSNGTVRAVGPGTATITVSTANGRTATCTVTVEKNSVPVEKITLSQTSLTLKVAKSATLTATVYPNNAEDKSVTWTSSNTAAATVENGHIIGINPGTATITATASNGMTASCTVKVEKKEILPEKVTLSNSSLTLKEKETAALTATVSPSNADDKTVTWTTSNAAVAIVYNGKVTAVGEGTATITVKTANGKTASCTVKVEKKEILPERVALSNTSLTLKEKESTYLTATVYPNNADDKSVTWSTSNAAVATVYNGKVTAVGAGTATITAKTANGKTASCTVKVEKKEILPEKVTLSNTSLTLKEKETAALTATVSPPNADDKTVTWTTSNAAVATVYNGKVTAVGAGTATITAKTSNGKTETCTVKVEKKEILPERVTLSSTSLTLKETESTYLTATVYPSNADDKTVTWSTSNAAVATVYNGKVTAVGAGTATITAKTANGKTASCTVKVEKKEILPEKVTLSNSSLTLKEKETAALTATVSPSNADDKTVTWTTSNAAVATVYNGKVTAVGEGTATITAKTANGKTATCTVKVEKKEILPERVTLSSTALTLKEKESTYLTATVYPSNADDKTVTWTTSNAAVATVYNGKVTAVGEGTATITAKTSNGKTASCTVKVEKKEILPEKVTLSNTSLTLKVKETATLSATVYPNNADDKSVTWTTSNLAVATVSNGKVTAVGEGTATITAKTVNGKTATCTVTVIGYPTRINILGNSGFTMQVKDTKKLTYNVSPEETAEYHVEWSTSDSKVVTVDANGKITAVGEGKATVTAKIKENGVSATVTVTVESDEVKASSVSMSYTRYTMKRGDSFTLSAKVLPENTTDKKLTWTSSDAQIATVSTTGVVTANKVGTATITAKTANGKKATCNITVKEKDVEAISISVNKTSESIYVGDTLYLTATVYPSNVTNKNVIWTTSDSSVATVSNGTVKALKAGKVNITAKTSNGKTATCSVVVNKKIYPTSIKLNKTKLTLDKGQNISVNATFSPSDANQRTITWSTSNSSVATVNNGIITAKATGTATITAKTSNGKTAQCQVTVNDAKEVLPTDVYFSFKQSSLPKGSTVPVYYKVSPSNATDNSVTVTSSDSSVIKISGNDITAVGLGKATITVTTSNGLSDSYEITVVSPGVRLTLPPTIKTYLGEPIDLADYTDFKCTSDILTKKDVKYSFNYPETQVGTLSGSVFTPKKAGQTYIWASCEDTKDYCLVVVYSQEYKVLNQITDFSISPSEINEEVGYSTTLNLNVTPSTIDASDINVQWFSDDPDIAYITHDGKLTLKKEGKTKISARLDNWKYAYCTVTVTDSDQTEETDVSEVYATLVDYGKTIYIEKGTKIKLDYYLSSANVDESKVKVQWKLGNSAKGATLDPDGTITAVDVGRSEIILETISYKGKPISRTSCYVVVKLTRDQLEAKQRAYAEEVLYYCNLERQKAGVPPLKLMDDLNYLSQIRAEEQTKAGKIGHTRPDGTDWSTVFQYASIKHKASGENVLNYAGTPESVVGRFMNSPGHKANILRSNFTHLGVGITFWGDDLETAYACNQIFIQAWE